MKKIIKYIKHPSNIILYFMNKGYFKWLDDEKYLKKIFLSGIETTLKATNDKELENRIKNFSNF